MEPLTHNPLNAVTGGIRRVRRGARSAVLKVLTRRKEAPDGWRHSEDPRHRTYWRTAADLYADGLPGVWAGTGLRAPELLLLAERDDGDLALWTEDVAGRQGTS